MPMTCASLALFVESAPGAVMQVAEEIALGAQG
jgi:hypothetical protein